MASGADLFKKHVTQDIVSLTYSVYIYKWMFSSLMVTHIHVHSRNMCEYKGWYLVINEMKTANIIWNKKHAHARQ